MARMKAPPPKARLDHDDMVKVLHEGGAVLHAGNIITREEDLPTDDELAETVDEKASALSDIDEQIAGLQARKSRMVRRVDTTAAEKKAAATPPFTPTPAAAGVHQAMNVHEKKPT